MDVIDLASWMNAIGYSQEIDDFFNAEIDDAEGPRKSAKKAATLMSIRNRFGSQGLAQTPLVGDLFYASRTVSTFDLGLRMQRAVDYYGGLEQELFNDACLDLETIADSSRLGPDADPQTIELADKHRDTCRGILNGLGGTRFGRAFWNGYNIPILGIQSLKMPDPRITALVEEMHLRMGVILDGQRDFKASQEPLKHAIRGLDLVIQGVRTTSRLP